MLSQARTGAPQLPQRDPGRTTDSPLGTRAMTTLKKLPQIAPHTAATAMAAGVERKSANASKPGPACNVKVRLGCLGNFSRTADRRCRRWRSCWR